jgi:uncharacterized membrane protein
MTRTYFALCIVVTIAALLIGAFVFQSLPERVPIHWNLQGQVDGYGPPGVAAFVVPGVMVGLLLLFCALPWLSPKQFEVDTFRETYWFITFVVMSMMGYIQCVTLWSATGRSIDMTRAIIAGLLLTFGLLGNVMGKVRRNFWVGVRTPWTLANDRVWNDTHRLAGRLFVGAALLCLPLLFMPVPVVALFFIVITLILSAAIIPAAYSAVHYKFLQARGQL